MMVFFASRHTSFHVRRLIHPAIILLVNLQVSEQW